MIDSKYKVGDIVHFTSLLRGHALGVPIYEPTFAFRYGIIRSIRPAGENGARVFDCDPNIILYYIESDDVTHVKQEIEVTQLTPEQDLKQLLSLFFKNNTKVEMWMETKNPLLGNISPDEMIAEGRIKKLVDFVRVQVMSNYE